MLPAEMVSEQDLMVIFYGDDMMGFIYDFMVIWWVLIVINGNSFFKGLTWRMIRVNNHRLDIYAGDLGIEPTKNLYEQIL